MREGTAASRAQVEDLIESVSRIARDLKDAREEMRRLGEKLDERDERGSDEAPPWVRSLIEDGRGLVGSLVGDEKTLALAKNRLRGWIAGKKVVDTSDED